MCESCFFKIVREGGIHTIQMMFFVGICASNSKVMLEQV